MRFTNTNKFAEQIDNSRNYVYLSGPVKDFETLILRLVIKKEETYRKNGALQCRAGRNRSFIDIFLAAKCNLGYKCGQALKELAELLKNNKKYSFSIFFCPDVQRVVIRQTLFRSGINATQQIRAAHSYKPTLATAALLENI